MSRYKSILFAGVCVVLAAIALYPVRNSIPGAGRLKTLFRKEEPKVAEPKPSGIPDGYKFKRLRRSDRIDLHRQAAASFGLPFLTSDDDLQRLQQAGKLVEVSENKGYKIHTLTHSHPVLIPEAREVLTQIGEQFWNFAGPDNFFMVTSLTRTGDDQKKLRRVNANATRNESTHCYGSSFDISYVRFNGIKESNPGLQKILEDLLARMKEEGRIYVIVERRSACFHITVRKPQ